jgi:cell division protein FtsI/penicillin-binding protein 2
VSTNMSGKYRGFILFSTLMGIFLVLLIRLATVQLVQGEDLRKKSDRQGRFNVELLPWRGTIYDRNGQELAISVSADSVCVRPRDVEKPDEAASRLAEVLGGDRVVIRKKLTSNRPFVWVKRKVEKQRAAMIGDIPGVETIEESKRSYPGGYLASHLIGFAGMDNYGLEGIELLYDRYLRGVPGCLSSKKDARGMEIAALRRTDAAAQEGRALVLTADEVIQHIVERELDRAYSTESSGGNGKLRVKAVTVIVMRPQTGEVLALANRPTFDPANVSFSTFDERRNRAVTDVFEPGSSFKIIPAAAALEEKLFQPDDMIFCENGSFRVPGHTIHDVHPYNWLTFSQVVEKSSNIGLAKIGNRLSKMTLYRYIRQFGFGEKTGCDLPGETSGLLRHPKRWSKLCKYTVCFGQGIGVNSMQLVSAFSAIANGGVLMRPMVVRSVIDSDGNALRHFDPEERRRVVSPGTARALTEMLVKVVESGTGKAAQVPGYRVAGKTGTAQKVDENGSYSHTRFVSSFVGYVPAYKPEIAILVVVDEPCAKPSRCYGGRVAGPVFRRIAAQTLKYLEIAPQDTQRRFVEVGGPMRSADCVDTASRGETASIIAVSGNSYYKAEAEFQNREYVVINHDEDIERVQVHMPDVCGSTMREVVRTLSPYGLRIKFKGSGIAVSQSPRAGRVICPGAGCVVTFSRR